MYRIAVLDDDPDTRELLSLWLEDDYHVVEFEHAAVVLRWLESGAVCDLIVSDISMPGIDGLEFIRRLRRELMSDVPVIAVSAHAMRFGSEEALAAGFNGYLPKPTDLHKLHEIILKCLDLKTPSQPTRQDASKRLLPETLTTAVPQLDETGNDGHDHNLPEPKTS